MPLALLRPSSPPPPGAAAGPTGPTPPPIKETDLDRILKLIPTEILAFYTAAVPISPQVPWRYFPFALFLICLALVPVVLYFDGVSTTVRAQLPQYIVRTLAFAAWAIAISWPFSAWSNGNSLDWLRTLAVFLVPLVGSLLIHSSAPTSPTS
jgi:hypothetical protein